MGDKSPKAKEKSKKQDKEGKDQKKINAAEKQKATPPVPAKKK